LLAHSPTKLSFDLTRVSTTSLMSGQDRPVWRAGLNLNYF